MTRRSIVALSLAFVAGAIVGHVAIPSTAAQAQGHKQVFMTRLYTGADNQTHSEEVELKFTAGSGNDSFKLLPVTGASLGRAAGGRFSDWHVGPRRQYVITLSGHGELEVAGGKKVEIGPGHINLVEDLTGKGHTTRVVGSEDRVTLTLPVADSGGK